MNLDRLDEFAEKLRIQSIGDPAWIDSKATFEYLDQSIEVCVVLKIIRATQGIHALHTLCCSGLFIDMGSILRCVQDSLDEVAFLLESYPERSENVDKFLKHFFSITIDAFDTSEEKSVKILKIQNAASRHYAGSKRNHILENGIKDIHKALCGYTHANYAHIMEMYGGTPEYVSFNLAGVRSSTEKAHRMLLVNEAYKSLLLAIASTAQKLGLEPLYKEVCTTGL